MSIKAGMIKQARCLVMRNLEIVYPSGLNVKYLYQTVCAVDERYDFSLLCKDIAYLKEKGYVELIALGGKPGKGTMADVKPDSMTVVKLTARGLEIAQDLIDDQALEI